MLVLPTIWYVKKQERLCSELLLEDKITNLLGFLTKQNPGSWSIYRVKNPSPQIRILVNVIEISLLDEFHQLHPMLQ